MPAKRLCVGSSNSLGIGFQTDECTHTHTQHISADKEMETEESDQTKATKKRNINSLLRCAKKYCKYEWLRVTFIQ